MIKIPPIISNISQTYYTTMKFSFDPTTLTVNISGTFLNQYMQKSITINKSSLLISSTVLYNSLTILYTYLTIDLKNYTYTSSITQTNSNDPYKPEFLIFLDDSLNSINDALNLDNIINNNLLNTSITTNISLTSFNSLSSDISNLANNSLYSLYSLTANYGKSTTSIDKIINSIFAIPYTKLYVDINFPSGIIYDYDSFYNINTKELFVFISGTWQKVNWQQFIKSDRLYKEGRLRINDSTSALEIQSTDGRWYEIVPTIGAAFTPVSYTKYVYYIAPGQIFNGYSSSIAPIIAINSMIYRIVEYHRSGGGYWFGIFPSGLTISDGYHGLIVGGASAFTTYTINRSFVPVTNQSGNYINFANISMHIYNNKLTTTSVVYGEGTPYIQTEIGCGTFPTNGYYLGVWCYEGSIINVDLISIKREM